MVASEVFISFEALGAIAMGLMSWANKVSQTSIQEIFAASVPIISWETSSTLGELKSAVAKQLAARISPVKVGRADISLITFHPPFSTQILFIKDYHRNFC